MMAESRTERATPAAPPHRNGGAAVVEALAAHGTRTVFGIPGTHNLEIYRHLGANGLRHVTPRHEQGAGYAADGHARVTGRPGVVITTTGPGLTNAMTAAATSYADSVPVLYISPGMPRGLVGRDIGYLHETKDSSAAMSNLVRWSRRVDSADEAAAAVHDAFASFESGRPRPVHIEVPVDVLDEDWHGKAEHGDRRRPVSRPTPTETDLATAADLLERSQSPMVVAGGGCVDAPAELQALAERLDSSVVTTCNGKGVLPESHPLAVGSNIRLPVVQQALGDADVVLVVGSELGDSDLWGGRIQPRTVVRADIDAAQLQKNCRADATLHGDSAEVLAGLARWLTPRASGAGPRRAAELRDAAAAEAAKDAGPHAELCRALAGVLPQDAIVSGDSSQLCYYGGVHLLRLQRPRRFLYMPGYATLGYALPAAIGGAVADPTAPVTALVGDGAFMFSLQELATAVEQRLPLAIVLADNGGYREIRDGMDAAGIERTGVDLHRPDFAALARSFGAYAAETAGPDALAHAVVQAWQADRPTVIVVDLT
jgi:thiamine pyrophosphate-dependent acetolactate synthase large subunit-like protein